jgi:hypothetical protein
MLAELAPFREAASSRNRRRMVQYVLMEKGQKGMNVAPMMPSDVDERVGVFDRLASAVSALTSRAIFFAFSILLIVVWAPSIVFFSLDTWQLIINTATTIITFLLVTLLQNTQTRADAAVQHKLNAIAAALAEVVDHLDDGAVDPGASVELRRAVGLEERESAS